MRAISRARSSSAAMRAVSSRFFHGVVGEFVGIELGVGSVSSRKTRRNCMAAAPLRRRRLRRSAQESVDDPAQVEQIVEPAEIVGNLGSWGLRYPISPGGRN